MATRRNPVIVWLSTTLSVAFARLTAVLPLPVARGLGRTLGRLAYYTVPRVRGVCLQNLDHAYGDSIGRSEKRRIAREAAENVGIVAAEFSRVPALDAATAASLVTVSGLEHLEHGGFMIGAHLGNWEWIAPVLVVNGVKIAEVVRPLDDPRFNTFVDRTRTSRGVRTIAKERSGPEILRLLREGWVVGALVDQSPREAALPVTFFGKPCWATVAPAMVALRAKAPIVAITILREADGRYTMTISPPIDTARTGDLRRDLLDITQRCQDCIEAEIRKAPGQWLWLHRRWKERPRLESEWRAKEEKSRSG
ncbi:MAG: lysophospholipid acyltransferase family protein [Candidatus Hydrogenedentes bacterium]|nr:lysophospholipid acyltransferase family protein [Candidatus Hydrogenedentota bacterium]